MTLYRAFLWMWIGGLVLFVIVIALSLPLMLTAVPGGVGDHQAAGTAVEVDRIQMAWRTAGLLWQAKAAMLADLVFIGVYGLGSVLGGLYFRQSGAGMVRTLGAMVALAGAVFLVADYTETLSEIVQLFHFTGDDGLAILAATVRPIKQVAWGMTFLGILAALALTRKSARVA